MKSAVFHGLHDIRVEETPRPVPGAEDVLIRVMACGVCGTDVHIYEGDKGAAAVHPPVILGHEFAGVVEAGAAHPARGSDLRGSQPALRRMRLLSWRHGPLL